MKRYSKEFKEEALKLSDEIGVKKAAQQLGIAYFTPQRGGPAHGFLAGGAGKSKIPLLAVRPLSRQQSH